MADIDAAHCPDTRALTAPLQQPGVGDLHLHLWQPQQRPRAAVLLVHGLAEHAGRYQALANALTAAGYLVLAPDLPGHGRSAGRRGHIRQFSDYLWPLEQLLARLQHWQPELPRFVLGHSMGGLVTLHLLLRHQQALCGAVLSGPALGSEQAPPRWQRLLLGALSRLWPTLGFLQLDASAISRDPAVVAAYENDPLVFRGRVTVRWITEAFAAMDTAVARARELALPMLILHGGQDRLTTPAGSRALCDTITTTDKTLRIYDALYHEVFNEPEAPMIRTQTLAWLDEHSSGPAAT